MSRTLVIGDIHGALKALKQIWERAEITPKDTVIFLGDYVDGWSQSAELIAHLMKLEKTHQCIFIRGNHDELCYKWLTEKGHNSNWLIHGGQATKESYEKLPEQEIPKHLDFFERLINFYHDSQNRLFLHAGFTNLKGIDHEYFEQLFYWDRTLWEQALSLNPEIKKTDLRYPKRLLIYNEIFIGHTPLSRINVTTPLQASCVWNVDTGAAFKGPLTVMDVNTKEFWQSDPANELYPDEKGRN